jgi:hypothetical protein
MISPNSISIRSDSQRGYSQMRSRVFVFVLFTFLISRCEAQSPSDGHTEGGAYLNSYFHISHTWPKFLQPSDTASLNLRKSPYENEFLLFSARQGEDPYGVVITSERLNFPTPHSKGIRDAADMVNMITRFRPDEHAVVLSKKHFVSASGLAFDEVDYTQSGGYSSGLVTPVGQYLIVFKCNAKSAADLAEMTKSATSLLIRK